jgi:hypothetical protein
MKESFMQISESMLDHYLSYLTVAWFARHDFPPADVAEYAPLVEDLGKNAILQGDFEALGNGLEFLLSQAGTDWIRYRGSRFPFTGPAVQRIARHLFETLWPEREIRPDHSPDVQLIPRELMDVDEWWERNSGKKT